MSNASVFLDRMSKDFIDRNQLLKNIDTIIEVAKSASDNDEDKNQFIAGLKAAVNIIKSAQTEY